jgi:DNA-binding transcriptional regulator/RsmH inhibitor MraZ
VSNCLQDLSVLKCHKVSNEAKVALVEPPLGAYSAHVDGKGRLQMPVNFKEYLESLEDRRLFVTTTDKRIARVYPILVWKANLKRLADLALENPVLAKSMSITARHYGEDAKLDANGKVIMPTTLRRLLGIEGQEVWLDATPEGCINVYSKAEYDAQLSQADTHLDAANEAAVRKGFV